MPRSWNFSAVCLLALLGAASCIAPEISGKYHLSEADVHEIQLLLWKRFDIAKPIGRISADTPMRAVVEAGHVERVGDALYFIPVEKRQGRWYVSPKAQWERIVITGI